MLRLMRSQRSRSAWWTAAYVACFVLVLSFIFFEILDVDGSDFAALARTATVKLEEPPQDLRRAPLQASASAPTAVVIASMRGEVLHVQRVLSAARARLFAAHQPRPALRCVLARALLDAPAPSAA